MDRFEKFRKLKSSLLGPQIASNDILADSRRELALYRKAISTLAKTVESFEKSMHALSGVNLKLVKDLEVRKDSPKCVELVGALQILRKSSSDVDLSHLKREITKVENGLCCLAELIEKRDAALNELEHYESKVSGLAKTAEGDKMARNNAKLSQATASFQDLNERATAELRGILSQRSETLKKLSTVYVSAYTKVSVDVHEAFARVRSVPDREAVAPPPVPTAPVLDD